MSREDEIRERLRIAQPASAYPQESAWVRAYATDIAYLLDRIKELEAEK